MIEYKLIVSKEYVHKLSLRLLVAELFSVAFNKFTSAKTAKENLLTACEMVYEFCDLIKPEGKDIDSKKLASQITKMKATTTKFKEILGNIKDRDRLIAFCFDFVLSLEGKGRLPGFGFCSKQFKNPVKGNPERESILT